MRLTAEQRQMVEDSIRLAYYARGKYQKTFPDLDPEEILSVCYLGLIKAVMTHNPDRGVFSSYAMLCMRHSIVNELKLRRPTIKPIYFEDLRSKDDDTGLWEDFIGKHELSEDEVIYKVLGEQIIASLDEIKMSETNKNAIRIHYSEPDLDQYETAEILGCSQVTVHRAFMAAKEKLKPLMAG